MDDDGRIYVGKALSTYPEPASGIFDSLEDAIEDIAVDSVSELLQDTSLFLHATTMGENALFERDGADSGLITTEGFEETLHHTRGGYGMRAGLSYTEVKNQIKAEKPDPLVPQENIEGVKERAYHDNELLPLDEEAVRGAVDSLVGQGVESIACCFLWSHRSPEHEQRVKEIIEESHPELYVTISSDIAPYEGEYERTSTAAINSYIGPAVRDYLDNLKDHLGQRGFNGSMMLMFSHGGLVTRQSAVEKPIGLVESGPVGGLMGSAHIGELTESQKIISADMGGTTFKLGLVNEGRIEYADEPEIGRHHYQFAKRDVHSIAVAGGSHVWLEDETNVPHIGPESTGSNPGPIVYGNGGETPTVTDVDFIQGYFSPEFFLGGGHDMAPDKARSIFEDKIADPLGKSVDEAAADIYRLTNTKIADLLRKVTIEKGIDPREFTLLSIGGASGMHAASYARELDIPEVVVPQTASVHSAFGLLSTDVAHEYTNINPVRYPFDVDEINEIFAELEEEATDEFQSEGFSLDDVEFDRSIGIRYQGQVNEINTPVNVDGELSEEDLDTVFEEFERQYVNQHGEGSEFVREAIEMIDFNLRGTTPVQQPDLYQHDVGGSDASDSLIDTKPINFAAAGERVETGVYDFTDMMPGHTIQGPAIILTPITSIAVNPGDTAKMDRFQNIKIDIQGENNE
jgi:N-methylhydantoinase A